MTGHYASGKPYTSLRRGTIMGFNGLADVAVNADVSSSFNIIGPDNVIRHYEPGVTYSDAPRYDVFLIVSRGLGKRLKRD
jgi:hypothetical protein